VVVVDTNVLVYAADTASPHHHACRAWLEEVRQRPDAWYLTWNIAYEFLRITTHPRVMRRPWSIAESWSFIEALVASPGASFLTPTDRHPDVVREVVNAFPELAGNLVHDARTVVVMREHGVSRICTRNSDFRRFDFLTVIDPLRPALGGSQ
jgi:toxin-antitoxin system PIN domain toxin